MNPLLQIVAVAAVAFVSTSADNLAAMIAMLATRELRPHRVAAGYLSASWLIDAAAWGASKLVEALPPPYLGLLGIVPLGLGVQRALALRRPAPQRAGPFPITGGAFTAGIVTLAQGADNSLVYASLFSDTANRLDPYLFTTLAVCATLWCALAWYVAKHSPIAGIVRGAMRIVLPFLLTAIGVYILANTATDVIRP